ncbi:MAG: IS66 family transposase [Phormidesmis sp.]
MSQREPKLNISEADIRAVYREGEEADIRAVYREGEEAVVALFKRLIERIEKTEERLDKLENCQQKDSQNSSKPPSEDGFRKRTKSLRKKSKRPSGGQPGHPGSTLEWRESVDEVVLHSVDACDSCGASLSAVAVTDHEVRQVHELPPLQLQVIEHRAEIKCCAQCDWHSRGQFPSEVNSSVQYGSGLKGLMVYLMDTQLLPSARTCEVLSEVLGCEVSEGTLYNARAQCFERLGPIEAQIKARIAASAVVHFDETGLRVKAKLWWLHVACTTSLTYYFVHPKRGQIAIDEMAVLPTFKGTSVHDGWQSYFLYGCTHSLCNAHHLRELRFIVECYQQAWAAKMMKLLIEVKTAVDAVKLAAGTALSLPQRSRFERRYQTLLKDGFKVNSLPPVDESMPKKRGRVKQSPPKNLLDRLKAHQSAVLAFMYNFQVPFDNNQAERDVRMMKLKQKISGCFRSPLGAQQFCRIRGYLSTLRKQGLPVLDALKAVFLGCPIIPTLQPE